MNGSHVVARELFFPGTVGRRGCEEQSHVKQEIGSGEQPERPRSNLI